MVQTEKFIENTKDLMKPKIRCNGGGCRKLIDFDKTYCDKHQPKRVYHQEEYWERKEKEGRYFAFYRSKSWRKASELYRINQPCCEDCLIEGTIRKVDVVDHTVELRDNWDKRLDESNYRSLCHFHHNRKTQRERMRREKEKRDTH